MCQSATMVCFASPSSPNIKIICLFNTTKEIYALLPQIKTIVKGCFLNRNGISGAK